MLFTLGHSILVFSLLCWAKACHAFCIYNDFYDGTSVYVHQYDNYGDEIMDNDTKFRAEIKAGEKACCNWTDSSCNSQRMKDALTRFVVWTGFSDYGRIGLDMLYLHSAGYAKIGGDPKYPTVLSYDPDGSDFLYFGPAPTEDYSDYY